MASCNKECEVYSRIVGYFRPVKDWNNGKQEEFKDRLEFSEGKALSKDFPEETINFVKKEQMKLVI